MPSATSSEAAWASTPWPRTADELLLLQEALARAAPAALAATRWEPAGPVLLGGCFVTFARHTSGPGATGDVAWAAAVAWRAPSPPHSPSPRRAHMALKGARAAGEPRRASDVAAQVVVAGEAGGPYRPGFLALRQGPLLSAAVAALPATPDVMLVDATGLDHPRWAGLAVHLGAVVGLPTVGVTDRALRGVGEKPAAVRGARRPVTVEGRLVGYWVSTRSGARPVLAHAGWRTDAHTAADAVLLASTAASRTPVPLQEARRVAREARALWGTGRPQGDRTGTLDGSPE